MCTLVCNQRRSTHTTSENRSYRYVWSMTTNRTAGLVRCVLITFGTTLAMKRSSTRDGWNSNNNWNQCKLPTAETEVWSCYVYNHFDYKTFAKCTWLIKVKLHYEQNYTALRLLELLPLLVASVSLLFCYVCVVDASTLLLLWILVSFLFLSFLFSFLFRAEICSRFCSLETRAIVLNH